MRKHNTSWFAIGCWIAWTVLLASTDASAKNLDDNKPIFHAFRLESDLASTHRGHGLWRWDFDGWIGGDTYRLWLKSEGERHNGSVESATFWVMAGYHIDTFWDAQIGLRHDMEPSSSTSIVLGVEGLAPYFFESEAHLFISQNGHVSARLRQEIDVLFSQNLIAQPYGEIIIHAQDNPDLDVSASTVDIAFGVQTRYEFRPDRGVSILAPYINIAYERSFGQALSTAKRPPDTWIGALGLRLLF